MIAGNEDKKEEMTVEVIKESNLGYGMEEIFLTDSDGKTMRITLIY